MPMNIEKDLQELCFPGTHLYLSCCFMYKYAKSMTKIVMYLIDLRN